MIKEAIAKAVAGKDLSRDEMKETFAEIMGGKANEPQIAAFITALRMKGESIDEITGGAEVMRAFATKINTKHRKVLDTCGTGGDASGTFNISTISAFVACGAGAIVAKHGNRSVSSKCGSADLLKELGVNIEADKAVVEKCIDEIGIGFLFAPLLHGAMKYATPVRRQIGIRTVFNVLGPLTNPAGARSQLLGVYDKALVEPLANALKNLGSDHALVVHGSDGMDEVTMTTDTYVAELKNGAVKTYRIDPSEFGFSKVDKEELAGGDAKRNSCIALDILNGKGGARTDAVLLNAGCAIYAVDKAPNIKKGIALAGESVRSGRALEKLNNLKELTNG